MRKYEKGAAVTEIIKVIRLNNEVPTLLEIAGKRYILEPQAAVKVK